MAERRERRSLSAAACGALCLGILCWMLVSHAWPLWTGETIYLRVPRPVDPRDWFRGEYVVLDYELSSFRILPPGTEPAMTESPGEAEAPRSPVPRPAFPAVGNWWKDFAPGPADPAPGSWEGLRGRRLCILLEEAPGGDLGVPVIHRPVGVSDRVGPGQRGLCGRVERAFADRLQGEAVEQAAVRVGYGIDALFVEEGAGPAIERALREGKPVVAEVAVTGGGTGRLKDLIIDGSPVMAGER